MQTRKWTDNAGVEKYSTEVVLTRFRGELTMLDSARDGGRAGAGGAMEGGYDDGDPGDFTGAPRTAATPSRSRAANADLDDEIPF